eukprot:11211463-Lingulodinium_polyedra.AAC.1
MRGAGGQGPRRPASFRIVWRHRGGPLPARARSSHGGVCCLASVRHVLAPGRQGREDGERQNGALGRAIGNAKFWP